MNKLYVLVGCPGSGKSTWVKEHAKEGEIIISRDEIRYSLLKPGEDYFSHETQVYNIFIDEINKNLAQGKTVFADATNLNYPSRHKLMRRVRGAESIAAIFIDTPLQVCIQRNDNRYGLTHVPENQLKRMYESLVPPSLEDEEFDEIYIIRDNEPILKYS